MHGTCGVNIPWHRTWEDVKKSQWTSYVTPRGPVKWNKKITSSRAISDLLCHFELCQLFIVATFEWCICFLNHVLKVLCLNDKKWPFHSYFSDTTTPTQVLPRWIYHGIMIVMIIIAVIVISANLPTVDVIQVAQVVNGCLLPFFAICLLLCLNDPQFMKETPQKW